MEVRAVFIWKRGILLFGVFIKVCFLPEKDKIETVFVALNLYIIFYIYAYIYIYA